MGLDIRMPLGMIFLVLGGIMTVYGIATRGSAIYVMSMGTNLNLIWGVLMLIFGSLMVVASRKKG